MPLQFGSWFDIKKPQWESYLDEADEDVINQTGLTREKLKQVLEVLHEHRIIN